MFHQRVEHRHLALDDLRARLDHPEPLRAVDLGEGAQPAAPAKPVPPDPRKLSDKEKDAKLDEFSRLWEDNRRNQDLIPVRTRRNGITYVGDMHYAPAAKFLKKVDA